MTAQYLRYVSLVVGSPTGKGIDLSDMQFKFEARRGDIQTPNVLTVRIYNLSKQTAQSLKSGEFTQILLKAGYQDNFGIIFSGTIKYVYLGHESSIDSYVNLVSADGDEAYNFAIVNTTLAAGSKPGDHVNVAAQAMAGYAVSYDPTQITFQANPLPRGKVMYGRARDVMRRVASDYNMTWSIQDGKIGFVLKTSYRPGDDIVLTSASGLIGFPEQSENGIIIRCLLNPAIKMGGVVKIDNGSIQRFNFDPSVPGQVNNSLVPSLDADGRYKVLFAQHRGDTRANDYYTHLTCIAVDPTAIVPAQVITQKLGVGSVPAGPVNPYKGP